MQVNYNITNMKPIKAIAGDILLFFYTIQRKSGSVLYEPLLFSDGETVQLPMEEGLSSKLKKIASPPDVYNCLRYLRDYQYLDYDISTSTGGDSMYNFRVTARGIDIIEGIERDDDAKKDFTINFNIKLAENITVESLIKTQLGSLFKASVLGIN